MEAEQAEWHQKMGQPGFYQQDASTLTQANQRLQELGERLQLAYARWEELEQYSAG